MKRIFSIALAILFLSAFIFRTNADEAVSGEPELNTFSDISSYLSSVETDTPAAKLDLTATSAVLMEASTGKILYAADCDARHAPASVTKVMTLLIIMEELDKGTFSTEDTVTTSEHAASMGGTQIYLEVGEQMSVNDLIKAIAVPSANDATVAMAEFVAGSEEGFVQIMNEHAAALGMENTHFTNCTGLFDDDNHYTTAKDMATMTRALLMHERIFDYTTIWMDTLRDGQFGLANTNKMLKTYSGMNGMKTGYTQRAKHCFSGTAKRDGMQLIATVMGAPSAKDKFRDTAKMLDFGFANFSVYTSKAAELSPIPVLKGTAPNIGVRETEGLSALVAKGQARAVEKHITLETELTAPIEAGTEVGKVTYTLNGETIKTCPVVTTEKVPAAGFGTYFLRLFSFISG